MTDTTAVARIDPFPFQHRVADLMMTDVPILTRTDPLAAAVKVMQDADVVPKSSKPSDFYTNRFYPGGAS